MEQRRENEYIAAINNERNASSRLHASDDHSMSQNTLTKEHTREDHHKKCKKRIPRTSIHEFLMKDKVCKGDHTDQTPQSKL